MDSTTAKSQTNGSIKLEYYSWLGKELGGLDREGSVTVSIPLIGETSVRGLLEDLAADSEPFRRIVYDLQDGRLREYVTLIVNGRIVELAGGLDSKLKSGDQLLLLPGFSGG